MDIRQLIRKKRVWIPVVLVLVYTITGFFILPVVSNKLIVQSLEKTLHRTVKIGKISINPYNLSARVLNFSITQKDGSAFVSADQLYVNASIASLFTLSAVVSKISIDNPMITVIRNKDKTFNFSDLMSKPPAAPADEASDKTIPGFTIENISVSGGKIVFDDRIADVTHHIDRISFTIPFLSSKKRNVEDDVDGKLDLSVNGTDLAIRYSGTPFAKPMESGIKIKTGNIDLVEYLPYVTLPEGLKIKDMDANLDLDARLSNKSGAFLIGLKADANLLNADIEGVNDQELIKVSKVHCRATTADLFSGKIDIPNLVVSAPQIHMKKDAQGRLNLMRYLPQSKETPSDENKANNDTKSFKPSISVDTCKIESGKIAFVDMSNKTAFKTVLSPVNVVVSNFTTAEKTFGDFNLNLKTDAGETVSTTGKFSMAPFNLQGRLSVTDLKIPNYSPYYEKALYFDIAQGQVLLDTDYQIDDKDGQLDASLLIEKFLLKSLLVKDRQDGEAMVDLPSLSVSNSGFDLLDQKITLGSVDLRDGKIQLKRTSGGDFNLAPPGDAENKMGQNQGTVQKASKPWNVALKKFNLQGFSVLFTDNVPVETAKVSLSDLSINGNDFKSIGTDSGRFTLNAKVNQSGDIKISGTAVPASLSSDMDISLEKLGIKSVQPYFADAVKIMVTQGDFNADGKVKINLKQKNKPVVSFSGKTFIRDFVSLDKASAKDFFKCNAFLLDGINFSVFPLNLAIKDISLTDFYSRLIVHEDGRFNLTDVFESDQEKTKGKDVQKKETTPASLDNSSQSRITVDSVTLQGGNIQFSDHKANPNFNATMKEITGSVMGLSSNEGTKAQLHLRGMHGQSSPMEITGDINPLSQKKYADVHLTFKDIELSNFTPYSARFLGYKIEKGKLILDLQYLIDGEDLKSENRVRFDNLTLGESVQSDEATSLPVGLAISLLKDSNDQINLDLPVSGRLNDPEFKIGSIVMKMIANLIVKVVTSPFSIIGSMFGGGEDLGYVAYDFGSSQLDPADMSKLDTLAKILRDKPSVRLEILGGYHAEKDTKALKEIGFSDLLKAQKLKDKVSRGSDIRELKDVTLDPAELDSLIVQAYDEAQFSKPLEEDGSEKELDVAEKKKLLITHIPVTEDDLRLLAMSRAEAVKNYLIENGGIEKERIFLLEPKPNDTATAEDSAKITFSLK